MFDLSMNFVSPKRAIFKLFDVILDCSTPSHSTNHSKFLGDFFPITPLSSPMGISTNQNCTEIYSSQDYYLTYKVS